MFIFSVTSVEANRVEAVVSNNEVVGRAGESGGNFKGYALGVSQTHFVLLVGNQDMKSKKFDDSAISKCILGKLKHHKGFKWFRIDENFDRSKLKTLRELIPFDQDSESRLNQLLNE